MKNKIKNFVYTVSAGLLIFPVAFVRAEEAIRGSFDKTVGGGTALPDKSIMGIAINIMDWLLKFVGIAGVIGFAIAGVFYLTAAGDGDRIKTAKAAMVNSVIGVLVAIAGVVALNFANSILGGQEF